MLKRNSINVRSNTEQLALQIWCLSSENRLAGKLILDIFLTCSLKAHYYVAYHIGADL